MSRKTRIYEASSDRARQAAAQLKPAAAQVKPLAKSTGAAARRGVRRTRVWAAPQVERTGQVLQDSVAPKVSALLSSAAQRIDPAKPQRSRWRKTAGIAGLTAAASAVAALVRNRMKPGATASAAHVDPRDVAPAAKTSDGNGATSTDAGVNGEVHTS